MRLVHVLFLFVVKYLWNICLTLLLSVTQLSHLVKPLKILFLLLIFFFFFYSSPGPFKKSLITFHTIYSCLFPANVQTGRLTARQSAADSKRKRRITRQGGGAEEEEWEVVKEDEEEKEKWASPAFTA